MTNNCFVSDEQWFTSISLFLTGDILVSHSLYVFVRNISGLELSYFA